MIRSRARSCAIDFQTESVFALNKKLKFPNHFQFFIQSQNIFGLQAQQTKNCIVKKNPPMYVAQKKICLLKVLGSKRQRLWSSSSKTVVQGRSMCCISQFVGQKKYSPTFLTMTAPHDANSLILPYSVIAIVMTRFFLPKNIHTKDIQNICIFGAI